VDVEPNQLNRWLTLAANLGVIVGIAFLIVEIEQTNRIARYEAEIGFRILAMDLNAGMIENSETYAKLQLDEAELTPSEQAQALMMARRLFNFWATSESAYNLDLISERRYHGYLKDIPVTLQEALGLVPSFAYLLDVYEMDTDASLVAKRVTEAVRGADN
jgi:hypothetical protein